MAGTPAGPGRASGLAGETAALRRWLTETALPLWWETGADRAGGGFHEAINLDGRPAPGPHRARTIARQVFVYCEAGRLGWAGPWRAAATHALDYFRTYFITADATVASVVGLDGKVREAPFDLYDQAFALLAFAMRAPRLRRGCRLAARCGWRCATRWNASTLIRRAATSRIAITACRSAPTRTCICSKPRWHGSRSTMIPPGAAWRDGIATLCLDKFIDPATGALREFFAADWSPAPGIQGRIAEPGHHYEWAFLLDRWAKQTGRDKPAAVGRLIAFADAHGLDARRGVAIGAVLVDGSLHDPVARLWAQAERVRAYTIDRRPGDSERLAAAIRGLRRFLATPTPGTWFDQLRADDRFVDEPARATSLYHIVGAVAELPARDETATTVSASAAPGDHA